MVSSPQLSGALAPDLDLDLVRRFSRGEDSAFDAIIARHRQRIFALAFARLRNHSDAEEIVQDTFIRAYRGLGQFRGDSSLATWLHSIAVRLTCNRYWYHFRRHRHNTDSLDRAIDGESHATLTDLLASESPDPAQNEMDREFSSRIMVCMEQLGAHHREILIQRNLLDRSYEEIAGTLGINVGTVKSRIARARQSLRGLLESAPAAPETERPRGRAS